MFAEDAIGFYLQLNDTLTPSLKAAGKGYAQFTQMIDQFNRKAVTSANKGITALRDLVDEFTELPKTAVGAYERARKALAARKRPIKLNIELAFTAGGTKAASKTLHQAMGKALTGKGKKGFADGGVIGTPEHRISLPKGDDQLIAAQTGEVVLPRSLVHDLLSVLTRGPQGGGYAHGGGVGAWTSAAPRAVAPGVSMWTSATPHRPPPLPHAQPPPLPDMHKATDDAKGLKKAVDDVTDAVGKDISAFERLFSKILGPARFVAVNKALHGTQEILTKIYQGADDVFHEGGARSVDDFVTNFNQLNAHLGLSRQELSKFKVEAIEATKSLEGSASITDYSAAVESLTRAGMRNRPVMLELAKVVTLSAKATQTDATEIGKLAYRLQNDLGLTRDQIAGVLASQKNYMSETSVDFGQLVQQTDQNLTDMGKFLRSQTADDQQAIIKNSARLTAALENNWAGGAQLAGTISKAVGGDFEAMQTVSQQLGVSITGLEDSLKSGDFAPLLQNLADKIKGLSPQGLEQMRQALHFEGTTSELSNLADKIGDVNKDLTKLKGVTVGAKGGMDALTVAAQNNTTAWQKVVNQLGAFLGNLNLFGVRGVEVLDFLKEFGLQNIHAAAYLGKLVFDMGAATLAWFGFGAAKDKDTVSTVANTAAQEANAAAVATSAAATETATVATATWGARIAELGAGIGSFIGSVGAGVGTAIFETLSGIAAGIEVLGAAVANPIGLAGLAALVALMFTLGVNARIAAPALEVIGRVVEHGMDSLVALFSTFMQADPKRMLAFGPALAAVGLALPIFGSGLAVGMNLALVAVPAMFALAAASAALRGSTGGASGLGDAINGLADAFNVDPAKLDRAAQSMAAAAKLVVSFVALSVGVRAASVFAGGGLAGFLLKAVVDFYTGDPAQTLGEQSREISRTVELIAANIGTTNVKGLEAAGVKMEAIGKFMEGYGKAADAMKKGGSLRTVKSVLSSGGVWDWMMLIFTGDDLDHVVANIGPIKDTITTLANEFSNFTVSSKLPQAAANLKPIGDFMEQYARISTGISAAANPGGMAAQAGRLANTAGNILIPILNFLPDPSDAERVSSGIDALKSTVTAIVDKMGDPQLTATLARAPAAMTNMQTGVQLANRASELFKAMDDLAKVADGAGSKVQVAQNVTHNLNVPRIDPADLQKLMTVTVAGHVDASDPVLHALIQTLIDEVRALQGKPAGPGAPKPTAGKPSPDTQRMAAGG